MIQMNIAEELMLVGAAILLIISGCVIAPQGFTTEEPGSKLSGRISGTTGIPDTMMGAQPEFFSLVQDGYSYDVILLKPEELTLLASKYPVVYGGLDDRKDSLAVVQFSKNGKGMLYIYDTETKEIVRSFNTDTISLFENGQS